VQELVYECGDSEEEVATLRGVLQRAMVDEVLRILPLRVPLQIKVEVGRTLGTLQPVG
jgi:hypothetical protein